QEDSMFSQGTREYYAGEIRKGATKSLIFGALSIFCCPPLFAYLGYTTAQEVITNIEIYEVEENKRGLAQTGKILSIIGVVLWTVSFFLRIIVGVGR
ncbi:MAG TPA: hypothetical protein VF692_01180, partial [Pyrinomonadaceae bacterium]